MSADTVGPNVVGAQKLMCTSGGAARQLQRQLKLDGLDDGNIHSSRQSVREVCCVSEILWGARGSFCLMLGFSVGRWSAHEAGGRSQPRFLILPGLAAMHKRPAECLLGICLRLKELAHGKGESDGIKSRSWRRALHRAGQRMNKTRRIPSNPCSDHSALATNCTTKRARLAGESEVLRSTACPSSPCIARRGSRPPLASLASPTSWTLASHRHSTHDAPYELWQLGLYICFSISISISISTSISQRC